MTDVIPTIFGDTVEYKRKTIFNKWIVVFGKFTFFNCANIVKFSSSEITQIILDSCEAKWDKGIHYKFKIFNSTFNDVDLDFDDIYNNVKISHNIVVDIKNKTINIF